MEMPEVNGLQQQKTVSGSAPVSQQQAYKFYNGHSFLFLNSISFSKILKPAQQAPKSLAQS